MKHLFIAVAAIVAIAATMPGCTWLSSESPCPSFRMSVIFYGATTSPDGAVVYAYGIDFSQDGKAEVFVDGTSYGERDDRDPFHARVEVTSPGPHTWYARRGNCVSPPFDSI